MSTPSRLGASIVASIVIAMPTVGAAQWPAPPATADSAVAESLAVLDTLEAALRHSPRDASIWHRRGMVAWSLIQRRGSGATRRIFGRSSQIENTQVADSSLRLAALYAPDSTRFQLDLAHFFFTAAVPTLRIQAASQFERAAVASRHEKDPILRSQALDEMGMVYWRRYESVSHRREYRGAAPPNWADYREGARELWNFLANFTYIPSRTSGDADFQRALGMFREARASDAGNWRALRHLLMAHAEQEDWSAVRKVADEHLAVAQWDATAWLARGLASHRLHDDTTASAAFDSALSYATEAERERMMRLSRILRPGRDSSGMGDSARYASLTPGQRVEQERLYWLLADPLALTAPNEHRLEFLSRVTFADLRWSTEDLAIHGSDTDRGDIYVRYGPPDTVAAFPPEQGFSPLLWAYTDGLFFVFRTATAMGVGTINGDYLEKVRLARNSVPVRWTNVDLDRALDSIPVRLARFRAGTDSTDVVVFADLPVDSLVSGVDAKTAEVDVDFRIYDTDAGLLVRDSTRQRIPLANRDPVRLRAWRARITNRSHLYRVEALEPMTLHGARSLALIPKRDTLPFTASDLLIADRVLPREGRDAERWSDLVFAPNAGRLVRHQQLGLIWETYGLRPRDGGAHYHVEVELTRSRGSGGRTFVAQVVSGVQAAVGRRGEGSGRVSLSFDRTTPARDAVVDYLTIDLGDAAPGRYMLHVTITDLNAHQTVTRESPLVIVE